MDKEQAVEELRRRGYDASKMGGVVMIEASDKDYKMLQKVIKEIGYKASWGIYVADDH